MHAYLYYYCVSPHAVNCRHRNLACIIIMRVTWISRDVNNKSILNPSSAFWCLVWNINWIPEFNNSPTPPLGVLTIWPACSYRLIWKAAVNVLTEQNFTLSHLHVADVFYERQLWFHNFSVHSCGTGQAMMYTWPEPPARRRCGEVISESLYPDKGASYCGTIRSVQRWLLGTEPQPNYNTISVHTRRTKIGYKASSPICQHAGIPSCHVTASLEDVVLRKGMGELIWKRFCLSGRLLLTNCYSVVGRVVGRRQTKGSDEFQTVTKWACTNSLVIDICQFSDVLCGASSWPPLY